MKTNNLSYVLAIAAAGAAVFSTLAQVSANSIPLVAGIVGYFAVVALIAVATIDYRSRPKSYLAR